MSLFDISAACTQLRAYLKCSLESLVYNEIFLQATLVILKRFIYHNRSLISRENYVEFLTIAIKCYLLLVRDDFTRINYCSVLLDTTSDGL